MSPEPKEVYRNPKQLQFLRSKRRRKGFMGGRGVGKSTVLGDHNYLKFRRLPRAKSALLGLTYNALMNRTLPSMEQAWNMNGIFEYDSSTRLGHYIIGRRPPNNWRKPWQPPRNYEHVISFINGYTIEMMSQERPDANRGGNYDAADADESALLKEEFVNRIANASIRGNTYRYSDPLHQSFCDFTSPPWTTAGQWIFRTEELMLEEETMVAAGKLREEDRKYDFIEAKTEENLLVLGQDYLTRMQLELSHWEYQVEILNFRLKKLPNGFYPGLNDERHSAYKVYEYDVNENGRIYTKHDNFIKSDQKLILSFDFNAAFTSMIICQEVINGNQLEFRIGNNLWVKPGETERNLIDALVDKFCEAYKNHRVKVVDIFGDRNGNSKSAQSTITFYEQIILRLQRNGWQCYKKVDGLDMEHDLRHLLVNALLNEEDPRAPRIRFHHEKAKATMISMQNAPILLGFKKDKRDEGKPIPQELATHLSDCFDNVVCRLYNWVITGDSGHIILIG